jgi:hypothetical protein
MSPDWSDVNDGPPDAVAFGDLGNPQSLNLYGYVQNNPLSNVDPDGHDCIYLNSDNSYNHTVSGDCTSDTDSGYYVDGHVSTVYTTTGTAQGTVTGFSGTSNDGNLMTGSFASSLPYGPLEGPENLAGASLIGNTAGGVVNGLGSFEFSIIFPWETLAAQVLSAKGPNGTQMAAISRKPGTLGMRKGTDALRREDKIARDVTKALGLNEKEAEAVHGLLQEGSQQFERPMTYTEALEYVGSTLGKMPK